jgi:hypothetical protein
VDISAFGGQGDIFTIDRMGSPGFVSGDYFANFDGTSAAAPEVSGVLALLLSDHPDWTENQAARQIYLGAIDMGTAGKDPIYGVGRLNANNVVRNTYPINPDPSIASSLNAAPPGQTVVVAAGTHQVSTDLVVRDGITLQLDAGAELWFDASKGLKVYGSLRTNGTATQPVKMTSTSGSWAGITFYNHAPPAGGNDIMYSSLVGCVIDHANIPIAAPFTSYTHDRNIADFDISGCTIQNSTFGGDAGIALDNCTVNIDGTTVLGLSTSGNGIRLTNCWTFLTGSKVQFCGGDGIVVSGYDSNVFIYGNMVRENSLDQIFVLNTIDQTYLEANFIANAIGTNPPGNGIAIYQATAWVVNNTVMDCDVGVNVFHLAGASNGCDFVCGQNDFKSNNIGVNAYYSSTLNFDGVGNLFNNTMYNLYSSSRSTISIKNCWWGQSPPDVSKIFADGSSRAFYSPFAQNYIPGAPLIDNVFFRLKRSPGIDGTGHDPTVRTRPIAVLPATAVVTEGDDDEASGADAVANDATGLYRQFCRSADPTTVTMIENLARRSDAEGLLAAEALPGVYARQHRMVDARRAAEEVQKRSPGTEAEMHALAFLAWLAREHEAGLNDPGTYVAQLQNRFGSDASPALMAAIGAGVTGSGSLRPTPKTSAGIALLNTPNPYGGTTEIRFVLEKAGDVSLKIYDVVGREVADLVHETRAAGAYAVPFNASALAPGVYFCRLVVPGSSAILRTVHLK